MGADKNDIKSIRILKRIVTWCPDRIEHGADQRHAETTIKQTDLAQEPRAVIAPGFQKDSKLCQGDLMELSPRAASLHRGMASLFVTGSERH